MKTVPALAGGLVLVASLVAASPPPSEVAVPEGHLKATACSEWLEATYRIDTLSRELGLDLADDSATVRACVDRDANMMKAVIPIGWCDNVLKIHCSGLDLLAEIGAALVLRCEGLLGESLGLTPGRHRAWRTCGSDAVFDRYSAAGEASDEAACRSALLRECGTNIDPRIGEAELSAGRRAFVECCSAKALDSNRREADRCGMIDESFERGPCRDRSVCVDRLTGDWLSCDVLE